MPADILAVIGRLRFVYARTMPQLPHEYTVRERAANDADYVALYEAIMRDGVIEWWCGAPGGRKAMPARYLNPGDNWIYWSMSARRSDREGRHPLEISHHINRCRIEERQRLIAAGRVSPTRPENASDSFVLYPAVIDQAFVERALADMAGNRWRRRNDRLKAERAAAQPGLPDF